MRKLAMAAMVAMYGCAGAGPGAADECRPLDMMCDADAVFHCAPDVDLIRRGQHVYIWQELVVCDDDEVLGSMSCIETLTGDRVEAECEFD